MLRSNVRAKRAGAAGRQARAGENEPPTAYRLPPDRAWWPAVSAPLERGVKPHLGTIDEAHICEEAIETQASLSRDA